MLDVYLCLRATVLRNRDYLAMHEHTCFIFDYLWQLVSRSTHLHARFVLFNDLISPCQKNVAVVQTTDGIRLQNSPPSDSVLDTG